MGESLQHNSLEPEIRLEREADTPLYRQLAGEVAGRIKSGTISQGSRLPSVRGLARRLGVSLITVVQAYDVLAAEGLIHSAVGRGTYAGMAREPEPQPVTNERLTAAHGAASGQVASGTEWQSSLPVYLGAPRVAALQEMLRPAMRHDVIGLAGGIPDPSLFPLKALGRLWHRVMAVEDPRFLQYGSPLGDASLRAWIAAHCGATGVTARTEDVLITSGSQQAIDLVARTFVGPGDYVLVESPTFPTALDIFEGRGAKLLGVPVDREGMRVETAAALMERFRPRLIYTIPTAQSPTGTTLSDERRRRLVALARQHNLLVLEDDTCSEFTYDGEAPPAVKAADSDGHVVFARTFSKTVIPGLRVGCIVAHGSVMGRLVEAKLLLDRFTSPLIQRTLWRYLSSRQYQRDLDVARTTYRRRRDTVHAALKEHLPAGVSWTYPEAGFNLWLELPDGVSAKDAFEQGIAEGVACGLGDLFLPHTPPPAGLRVSFADKPEAVLVEGIGRLGRALRKVLERRSGAAVEREYVTSV